MNVVERMSHFNVPGVSVSYFEDAEIKWNKFFGVMEKGTEKSINENSIFHACSISKMITALCVLSLAQDGKLDLHRDVNEYLVSWKIADNDFTEKNKVTLARLLSHQAGLYDLEGSFAPYKSGDKIPSPIDIITGATAYHKEDVKVKYIPETDSEYSDVGYSIISQVLQDVFGEAISQIAKRIVFDPLGLQKTFFWEIGKEKFECFALSDCVVGHDNSGDIVDEIRACYPNIEGAALWTTTRELSLIVIDTIKSYQDKSGKVLTHDMAKFMLSPFGCSNDTGMGVFLVNDSNGNPYFFSQGWGVGMQCKLRAYYKSQKGVVVMTNSEPGVEQDESLVGEIIEYVCINHEL
ncbi:MAG: beta-lactamase family protein [Oscillospiraceae bacterium]|jgi:CubicO group peptidase (beta-lactamase class C family)|nr:beta-lactamase family protein [Oscillospiraceae bacterium]